MAATTQERIAELERQRTEAVAHEEARLAREQSGQQAIAQADLQLAALRKQASAERFQEALQENARYVAANEQAVAPLVDALNAAAQLVADAMQRLAAPVDSSFQRQQSYIDGVLSEAMKYANVPATTHDPATADPRTVQEEEWQAQRLAYGKLNADVGEQHGAPAWAWLLKWVSEATGEERRIRQGIYHAVTGQSISEPSRDYSPRAEITQQRRAIRARRQ